MGNLKKGDLEQIYTPDKITDFLIEKVLIPHYRGEIVEILEPCAGAGHMVSRIKYWYPTIPIIQFDIDPKHGDIQKLDFMNRKDNKLEYKKGRITIMNPPFTKGLKFIYRCLELSDYVVTITSSNSFMNIDYDNYYVDELYFIKKARFSDGNDYAINLIAIRKKDFWDE